jgi:hypothetical protein
LGQLLDLPSLYAVLSAHGIKSNRHQIHYKKLCKQLTNNKLCAIYESIFSQILTDKLHDLQTKSESTWSRMVVTSVLDDSVFRQWLENMGDDEHYKSWFSGQFGRTVWGFKVLTFGLVIDGVFYPLFLQFVKKGAKNDAQHVLEAVKSLEKWGKFKTQLAQKGIELPPIHLSCDNGYSDKRLEKACQEAALIYISVPKISHLIRFNEVEMSFRSFIDTLFLPAEKAFEEKHEARQKDKKTSEKTSFLMRIRCFYKALDKDITVLVFRLKGSKKVSVIYCTDKNIMAKSLRRHWFQRTQIEQFFRLIKHTLKIAEAKTRNKAQFENKIFRFVFVALHAQLFTRLVRKKIKACKKYGFEQIRRLIIFNLNEIDELKTLLKTPFA